MQVCPTAGPFEQGGPPVPVSAGPPPPLSPIFIWQKRTEGLESFLIQHGTLPTLLLARSARLAVPCHFGAVSASQLAWLLLLGELGGSSSRPTHCIVLPWSPLALHGAACCVPAISSPPLLQTESS